MGTLGGGIIGGQLLGGNSAVGTLTGGVLGGGVADKLLGTGKSTKKAPYVGASAADAYAPRGSTPVGISGRGATSLSV